MGIVRYRGKEYRNIDFADIYSGRVDLYSNKKFVDSINTERDCYAVISNSCINVLHCLGSVYIESGVVQIIKARFGHFKEKYCPFTKCSFEIDCQYSDVGFMPDFDKVLPKDNSKSLCLSGKFSQVNVGTCLEGYNDLSCIVKSTRPDIGYITAERVYSISSPKKSFMGFQMFFWRIEGNYGYY